ncbi:hypothetical protein QP222_05630 [Corynebacterium pyruviciproducens]|uniref:hypothetical protein n=1 Tax=Corynebacterium pyruviciproducens TaxID=598660 RepID=UPI0025518519|nr:hypothetical protein [Corynebacterium pyruviciproducens]MDK6565889.1 hypothetical protein [Corynebacterium pyruviciproducens]
MKRIIYALIAIGILALLAAALAISTLLGGETSNRAIGIIASMTIIAALTPIIEKAKAEKRMMEKQQEKTLLTVTKQGQDYNVKISGSINEIIDAVIVAVRTCARFTRDTQGIAEQEALEMLLREIEETSTEIEETSTEIEETGTEN